MDDIEPTPHSGASQTPESLPQPAGSERHRALDLIGMVTLLGLSAGVYIVVGDAGFSMVVGAVVGLYGAWRTRQ
ncbi:hypothetical protein P1P75_24065 [Streptomyces sp. ID05-39B]|uniref:hypothetical protein n=1 Tax=Streptomyces sp. ID05-39B TaxID=3028664 RepID=UPI0029AF99C4|nr:hypothetical protein [Streptomyces sp. ID05-39B]MDX3529408.1 hypothetical protein [Streptomyces sp. ID05-39B]